ncbi:hypothetical protein LVJ94_34175 [Pendulispora rubella]|uniref:Uncharacterized protein n=1 Tax=Pendulispora rubella TaxID=2741070 RepID=A0ABZ2KTV9_9BACT
MTTRFDFFVEAYRVLARMVSAVPKENVQTLATYAPTAARSDRAEAATKIVRT